MRYYELTVTQQGSSTPFRKWTSYPNGKPDPGALNIMFDMIISEQSSPVGQPMITIEGISLSDLSEAQQFAGMNVTLKAGMGGGLPLETKAQQGTIMQGQIFQSFGNWVGTEMTLDFVLNPAVFDYSTPGNFVLNWTKGQKLSDAINQMLTTAYTKTPMPISINISDDWVADQDLPAYSYTLDGISEQIAEYTLSKSSGPVGVAITIQNGKILVQDSTYSPDAIQINFNDLIGQPTWIDPNTMQISTVMRADLQFGSKIKMPKGFVGAPGSVTTTAQSMPSSYKYKSTFTQDFQITQLRHIGNFRSSDAGEWATVCNCLQL